MADERLKKDPNRMNVSGGLTNDSSLEIVSFRVNPVTKRLLVETEITDPATEDKQDDAIAELQNLVGLEIPPHDYISLSYTGSNLTGVVYKTGGSGGTTVATLTLGYDGSDNLISVTKT